jgi:hypothetical protein
MALRPLAVAAVVAALVAAGCGELGEPDLGVVPASTTTTTAVDDVAGAVSSPSSDDAPYVAQLTPTRPVGFTPQVLLADASSVRVLDGPLLVDGVDARRAIDDPTGGLVVQVSGPDDERILWFPAASSEGQVVAQGELRLLDVGFVDAAVHAVVTDESLIRLVRLGEPGERDLTVLEPGTRLVSLSAAAGLYALILDDGRCGQLRFLRPDGEPIEVGGVPSPVCEVPGRTVFGLVAFSPDGETFAYTERTFRTDSVVATTELVVRDLLLGNELFRGQVGGEAQRVLSLALDGTQVLLLREAADGVELLELDIQRAGEVRASPADGVRSAGFTRVPLSLPPVG